MEADGFTKGKRWLENLHHPTFVKEASTLYRRLAVLRAEGSYDDDEQRLMESISIVLVCLCGKDHATLENDRALFNFQGAVSLALVTLQLDALLKVVMTRPEKTRAVETVDGLRVATAFSLNVRFAAAFLLLGLSRAKALHADMIMREEYARKIHGLLLSAGHFSLQMVLVHLLRVYASDDCGDNTQGKGLLICTMKMQELEETYAALEELSGTRELSDTPTGASLFGPTPNALGRFTSKASMLENHLYLLEWSPRILLRAFNARQPASRVVCQLPLRLSCFGESARGRASFARLANRGGPSWVVWNTASGELQCKFQYIMCPPPPPGVMPRDTEPIPRPEVHRSYLLSDLASISVERVTPPPDAPLATTAIAAAADPPGIANALHAAIRCAVERGDDSTAHIVQMSSERMVNGAHDAVSSAGYWVRLSFWSAREHEGNPVPPVPAPGSRSPEQACALRDLWTYSAEQLRALDLERCAPCPGEEKLMLCLTANQVAVLAERVFPLLRPELRPKLPTDLAAKVKSTALRMEITMPAGVRPGHQIDLQSPDGRHVHITVPPGQLPGVRSGSSARLPLPTPSAPSPHAH